MNSLYYLRFQVLTAASMKFRIVFWDIPEDNSELHCTIDLGCIVLFNEAFIQKMYANILLVSYTCRLRCTFLERDTWLQNLIARRVPAPLSVLLLCHLHTTAPGLSWWNGSSDVRKPGNPRVSQKNYGTRNMDVYCCLPTVNRLCGNAVVSTDITYNQYEATSSANNCTDIFVCNCSTL
jgi:hypothetical protein